MGNWLEINTDMNEKYTAKEWAMIEGGHTVETDDTPQFSFIRENLSESTMYRTHAQIKNAPQSEVRDFAFITLITLWLLTSEDKKAFAQDYATKTIQYRDFNLYRQAGTDLFMAIHRLVNDGSLREYNILRFLTLMSMGQPIVAPETWLLKLERNLGITNGTYKMLRRYISDWNRISDAQHEEVYNKLLLYYRSKAIRSELYPLIENLAKKHDEKMAKVKSKTKSQYTHRFSLGQEIHRPLI